jgi:hypothetical protein
MYLYPVPKVLDFMRLVEQLSLRPFLNAATYRRLESGHARQVCDQRFVT